MIGRLKRRLHSPFQYRRKQAIAYLSMFKTQEIVGVLANRLHREAKYHIRLMLINSLKYNIDQTVLRKIVNTLPNSLRYYQSKATQIIKNHLNQENIDLTIYFESSQIEISEFLCEMAKSYYVPEFKNYLLRLIDDIEQYQQNPELSYLKVYHDKRIEGLYLKALSAASCFYGFSLDTRKYLGNENIEIVKIAASHTAKKADLKSITTLASYATLLPKDRIYSDAIISICELRPELYTKVFQIFKEESDRKKRYLLAAVLSKKIDYLLLSITYDQELYKLLHAIIKSHYSANLINWINANKNHDLQK